MYTEWSDAGAAGGLSGLSYEVRGVMKLEKLRR